ncbi:GNAT family N-acetyltransferase [Flagellimonas zhangzhouensis]|uniref:GNAT family N-acetyltransferase n=1 Tax=Flagellimonas zhangzhouensis TaxID=1073328 RepID=UPI001586B2EB|nr:GNAT family N-acetyltransferase [Allomuricauda zhangzhouensis]
MKRKLPPFYAFPILNKITGQALSSITENLDGIDGNFYVVPDLPDYLQAGIVDSPSNFKVQRIKQYQGYACNLDGFGDVDSYLKQRFGKSSIKNMKARKRQLESRFSTSHRFFYGAMDKDHYDFLFDRFYQMLKSRFDEKKTFNRYLLEWNYYYELVYPMILKQEAVLYVIYVGDEPISISLEFCVDDICFGYIHGYDSTYHRYQIGDIRMMMLLDWMIAHNFKIFDTLMGETAFKAKWSNLIYDYHYEVFCLPGSAISRLKLQHTKLKLRLKQYLRDTGILGKWFQMDKFMYRRMSKRLQDFDWKEPVI